ncbi:MAG: hypothetical protein EXS55_02775 [Candidatus Magasanikbacteria bacterium]|nr:hypothetical protein [Candidatus Magasanikbacteria bacterium]
MPKEVISLGDESQSKLVNRREALPTPRPRRVTEEVSPEKPLILADTQREGDSRRAKPELANVSSDDTAQTFLIEESKLNNEIETLIKEIRSLGFSPVDRALLALADLAISETQNLPENLRDAATNIRIIQEIRKELAEIETLKSTTAREAFLNAGINFQKPVTAFIDVNGKVVTLLNCKIMPNKFRYEHVAHPQSGGGTQMVYEPAVVVLPDDESLPFKLVGLSQVQQDN